MSAPVRLAEAKLEKVKFAPESLRPPVMAGCIKVKVLARSGR